MIVHPLPADRLADWWPAVEPFARKMAARFPDDWPVTETLQQVRTSRLLLWAIADDPQTLLAVIGTERMLKPSGRVLLSVSLAAGDGAERWLPAVRQVLIGHARHNGCDAIEINGRLGWHRYLPDFAVAKHATLTLEAARYG